MKEKDLYRAVHKLLPKEIYHHSNTMASLTTNGIPDVYYDGSGGDMWVEYKMLTAMPRNGIVIGKYSALQLAWMTRRHSNSLAHRRNAFGVVGLPNRMAVIQRSPTEWEKGTPVTQALTIKEVAQWICDFCSRSSA